MKERISNPVKTSGKNVSFWTETTEPLAFSKLSKNIKCEVAVYVATGDSGNGITHGTIAGLIISDQIRGVENNFLICMILH